MLHNKAVAEVRVKSMNEESIGVSRLYKHFIEGFGCALKKGHVGANRAACSNLPAAS